MLSSVTFYTDAKRGSEVISAVVYVATRIDIGC